MLLRAAFSAKGGQKARNKDPNLGPPSGPSFRPHVSCHLKEAPTPADPCCFGQAAAYFQWLNFALLAAPAH